MTIIRAIQLKDQPPHDVFHSEIIEVSHTCLISDIKHLILNKIDPKHRIFEKKIEILKFNRQPIAGKIHLFNPAYFLLDSTKAMDEFPFLKKRRRGDVGICGEIQYIVTFHSIKSSPSSKLAHSCPKEAIMILLCGNTLKLRADNNTEDLLRRGSAFFIHSKYALCARHCLYQDYEFEKSFPLIYLSMGGGEYDHLDIHFSMEIIFEDADCDLAVLRIRDDFTYPHEVFSIASMNEFQQLMMNQKKNESDEVDLQAVWTEVGPHRNLTSGKCEISLQVRKKVMGFVKGMEIDQDVDDMKELIQFTKKSIDDFAFNLITMDGSLTSGSSGSPYFLPSSSSSSPSFQQKGLVIAMHLSSNNEGDLTIPEIIQGCMELFEAKEVNRLKGKEIEAFSDDSEARTVEEGYYDDEYSDDEGEDDDCYCVDDANDHSSDSSFFDEFDAITEYTEAYEEVKQGLVLCKCPGFVKWMRETLQIELNPSIS